MIKYLKFKAGKFGKIILTKYWALKIYAWNMYIIYVYNTIDVIMYRCLIGKKVAIQCCCFFGHLIDKRTL